ncbi:hypothetical protein A3F07_01715 [candidate division WWE3 bacterium RIFCSPHIGHO2_12_FULL_38_15]|uniref:Uncharacterized protein n=1 Tax=candidate division WWE3 bacterium RIFCSPHIGHO2_02_FULL_38_14 TaxID=1802620 RepID=A0A1F4V8Y6_UNCKA|nr:MAG: hypothetical protein A2793_01585 [candidate division WWE3 bacterium RIFCSPHIGHO2_01_FULL_38_45]OGC48421.1 MAG: hypothetical protein A3F07_01715 [candidate division WWE3 bacterium RIFCSPHIGHO2_12_FULL_38_15]OGC53604.1 MAG: hypothetical protein A3D91_04140 [candidate division WWE3 bacterium RIFCSPHIGHO2_02_FULL_38_14]OGC54354.1 MAG: hypothetical protein A3B64_02510 [candidate division WWE3 bacterium RIFCSPLOWO2_01_FULL_37_24]HLB51599.1 hypothetical protein [Patescibacteria group bacterium
MNKYLIEVSHEGNKLSCERAIKSFLDTGSHFMTNADWGCSDGEHKAWIVVDLETKDEALLVVPPEYRKNAKIVKLVKFSLDDVDKKLLLHHT